MRILCIRSRVNPYSDYATGSATKESSFDSRWGKRFFFSPKCPNRLWAQPSLLFNVQRKISERGKATGA